jgi:hypothetical protein
MSPLDSLPHTVRALVLGCPHAGGGVHKWLFRCAIVLHGFFRAEESMYQLLRFGSKDCGREVSDKEILDAIRNSKSHPGIHLPGACRPKGVPGDAKSRRSPTWPSKNYALIEHIARHGPGLAALSAMSPMPLLGTQRHTETVIDILFPGNPLICCGRAVNQFSTAPRDAWRGLLSTMQFLVPSPMRAHFGQKKHGGGVSSRCLDNTGPRRFLVIECDFKEKDENGNDTADAPLLRSLASVGMSVADLCAALHWHLAHFLPLVLVVHSGGKSLHGSYFVQGQSEVKLGEFMRYAVSLGADDATWSRCQLVRMPDGTRDNGNRQSIVYFCPEVLR